MIKSKLGNIISLVCMVVLGIALIIFPGTALTTLIRIIGGAFAIIGVIRIIAGCLAKDKNFSVYVQIVLAVIITIAGFVFIYSPEFIVSLFPIFMGLVIALTGVLDLIKSLEIKKNGFEGWNIMMILSIISICFGILVFANPFSTMSVIVRIIGIAMLYSGVSGIYISMKHKEG